MNRGKVPYAVRVCLMAALAGTAVLVVNRTFRHADYFALPGARASVAEAFLLLAAYLAVLTLPGVKLARYALTIGLLAAGLEMVHLLQERFFDLPGRAGGLVSLAFMLATFSCWGWAARKARALGASFVAACGTAVLSAVVTMTIAVCLGTVFEWYVAPVPLESMRGWAEFQRSGWNDLAAFAIANTIDSITSHLIMAPLIALVFGAVGAALGKGRMAQAVGANP